MTKKSKGLRSRSRSKVSSGFRDKFSVEKFFRSFNVGDSVVFTIDAASQKGMPHPRFKGMVGVVEGMQGRSYKVVVKTGGTERHVISRPEHIKLLKPSAEAKPALKG